MTAHPTPEATAWQTQAQLIAAVTAIALGQTLVFALLPLIGREVGLNALQIGIVISLSSAVYAWGTRYWGPRSDWLGRKRVILLGLLGYTIGTLVFAALFATGFAGWLLGLPLWLALVLARCLQSSVMAATIPGVNAYVSDITTPVTRTAGMARLGSANSVGTIIGPAVGGALAGIHLLAPLGFAALMTALTFLLLSFCLPESPRPRQPRPALNADGSTQAEHASLAYNDPRYRVFMLLAVVMLVCFSVIQQTLGLYFQDLLEMTSAVAAQQVGFALMLSALLTLMAQTGLASGLGWPARRIIRTGMACLMLGSGVLALAQNEWQLFVGVGLAGVGMGLAFPGCAAAASLAVTSAEQGRLAGLTASLPALGSILGPLIGTALYEWHMHAPYAVNVLLILPLWLFLPALKRVR